MNQPSTKAVAISWVALGGLLGSAARLTIGNALASPNGSFPTATLIVNLVGSAVLGGFVASREGKVRGTPIVNLVAVGLLGSFTTFSAFTREVEQMIRASMFGSAAVYVTASLVGGVLAAAGGYRLVGARR